MFIGYPRLSRTSVFGFHKKFHPISSLTPLYISSIGCRYGDPYTTHICVQSLYCFSGISRLVHGDHKHSGENTSEQNCALVLQSPVLMRFGKFITYTMLSGETLLLDVWSSGHFHVTCYLLFDWISVDKLHA